MTRLDKHQSLYVVSWEPKHISPSHGKKSAHRVKAVFDDWWEAREYIIYREKIHPERIYRLTELGKLAIYDGEG